MRTLMIAVACLLLAGCIPTEDQVIQLGNDVSILMEMIDEQQGKIDERQEKIVKQVDKVQDHVILVNDAIKAAEGLPEKAAAGIEASRPFNPYADQMSAVLGITTVLGGLFASKKSKEAKRAAAKYQAHKAGVDRATIEMNAEDQVALYDSIGKARAANGV